ncbi:MAG: cyclopropane-fatty-acyl-phospholipid synthase [Proteobacteria bacterium]|nr:cyclopropane-fatty-acyl-phospholipid synthase [Pseudomonadota bacterium]
MTAVKHNLWVRLVFKLLDRIEVSCIELIGPNGFTRRFSNCFEPTNIKPAILIIKDWGMFRSIVLRGDIAFGETYMEGQWDTPDLNHLLWVIGQNRHVLDTAIRGIKFTNLLNHLRHLLNKNTRHQARHNIEAHYDLGNDFYQLWLDESMTYSSAIRHDKDNRVAKTLEEAQRFKVNRALSKLGKLDGTSITLEIGCGWGELSKIRLETLPGQHVGITLSQEQKDWTKKTLKDVGLNNRNTTLLQDYRDISEQYDGIISIEMIEAVGKAYWETFFKTVKKSLKPNGRAVIQAITINETLVGSYETGVDFIQKYIFPGGILMSQNQFTVLAAQHRFNVCDTYNFGKDYAWTLHEWFKRFQENWTKIEALGFSAQFKRMWEFYLCYCRSGFLNGDIDVVQYTLSHSTIQSQK